jgi:hypothetical protein
LELWQLYEICIYSMMASYLCPLSSPSTEMSVVLVKLILMFWHHIVSCMKWAKGQLNLLCIVLCGKYIFKGRFHTKSILKRFKCT